MEYDIFESISQGEYGENATQNGRMEEWKKSPTSSSEAAQTMKQNLAQALRMEETYIANKAILQDSDGDIYVIDAEIKNEKNV